MKMNRIMRIIKEPVEKRGMKLNLLPNGVVVIVKDDYGFIQISAVLDKYYVRYLNRKDAFVLSDLNYDAIEALLDEKLVHLERRKDVLKIPDV